ncbi:glycosyltransferase family 2 protein [Flavobacterium sp. 5]|uniref:glycosyltransferase family 2 protein n=1 Tax=Flavobacterium sp. 5 TaxID=2035199 RepID=UPI000C2B8B4B|nr:glycosyltransferase family 2 protein [Flavobacterium sp. 5]PKB17456.1 glycosyltransferase involved in cell wall biosynthesis [Flavobacterium sp. 5]
MEKLQNINPLVSIIIPTYNRAHLIGETLDSVLVQTYTNWECIVVDDGSTDNSEEIIGKYVKKNGRILYEKRPANKLKGPSSCRNYGVEKSVGEYVIFLDSDDILEPFCLEQRIDFANYNGNFDFWVFKMNILADNKITERLCNIIPPKESEESIFYKKEFLKGNYPFTVTAPLWRARIVKESGFDEGMIRLEDPDFHLRVLQKNYKCITANDLPHDTYYRVDNSKAQQLNSVLNDIIESHISFLNKYYDRENEDTVLYFDRTFRGLVIPNGSIKLYFKAIAVAKKYKILTLKKTVISFIMLVYNRFNLHKIRGTGYTKLNSILRK